MNTQKLVKNLPLLAIFLIFIIFGVWEIINPAHWAGFAPSFITDTSTVLLLVRFHGIVLSLVGLWLISGFGRRIAAIFAFLVMLEINISLLISSGFSELLVRDFVILIITLYLIFEKEK